MNPSTRVSSQLDFSKVAAIPVQSARKLFVSTLRMDGSAWTVTANNACLLYTSDAADE